MATFLANEIKVNKIKRETTGLMMPFQIVFPLKDKKSAGYLKTFFWDVDE